MSSIQPKFSRSQVDRAGRSLVAGDTGSAHEEAVEILNNWRAAHEFPMQILQMSLLDDVKEADPYGILVQRLKRSASIAAKLHRFPQMRLSTVQDIGGLRAIVTGIDDVQKLMHACEARQLANKLVARKNYIEHPKDSGYRGIHLIYRFDDSTYKAWNGLLIELQLRTGLQHAWATAVETVESFLGAPLKASRGPERWLRFFVLVSAMIAIQEESPLPPRYTSTPYLEIERLVRDEALALNVVGTLRAYQSLIASVDAGTGAGFYLLVLRGEAERELSYTGFAPDRFQEAASRYAELEKEFAGHAGTQVVLVTAESVESLRRAYPNYFLDSEKFLYFLDGVLRTPR